MFLPVFWWIVLAPLLKNYLDMGHCNYVTFIFFGIDFRPMWGKGFRFSFVFNLIIWLWKFHLRFQKLQQPKNIWLWQFHLPSIELVLRSNYHYFFTRFITNEFHPLFFVLFVLVAVGEYNFPMTRETHTKMYQKYWPIVRECLGDENFIRLFDPQVIIYCAQMWNQDFQWGGAVELPRWNQHPILPKFSNTYMKSRKFWFTGVGGRMGTQIRQWYRKYQLPIPSNFNHSN